MIKYLASGIFLMQLSFSSFAQDIIQQKNDFNEEPSGKSCLQADYQRYIIENKRFESPINSKRNNNKNRRVAAFSDTIIIPIIVHVVHNGDEIGLNENISTEQVYSQIEILNQDFQRQISTPGFNTDTNSVGMKIKFVLAQVDELGHQLAEPGIHRVLDTTHFWNSIASIEQDLKPATIFDPSRYLNIWVVSLSGAISTKLGYTQAPNFSGLSLINNDNGGAETDGIVIRYNAFGNTGNVVSPFNKGRTLTHEMGHFFGLVHIWGMYEDNLNCLHDDGCDDTPKTRAPFYGCPSGNSLSCVTTITAMRENYMDYTDDVCMNIFTKNQIQRMQTVLQNSPRRTELATSTVYTSTVPSPIIAMNKRFFSKSDTITINCLDRSQSNPEWHIAIAYPDQSVFISTVPNFVLPQPMEGSYSILATASTVDTSISVVSNYYFVVLKDSLYRIPFRSNFENLSDSTLFKKINEKTNLTWQYNKAGGVLSSKGKSLKINNLTGDKGGKSSVISPLIKVNSNAVPTLYFDFSYAINSANKSDTLAIYFSIDTGRTFKNIYKRGGSLLQTVTFTSDNFVPDSSQWKRNSIVLTSVAGNNSVIFKFENISNQANNLYLDNINLLVNNPVSVPSSNFFALPTTICSGQRVQITDISEEFPTAWTYTVSGIKPSNVPIVTNFQNPRITFNNADIYSVSLRTANAIGEGDTILKPNYITVNPLPEISHSISHTGNSMNCGTTINLVFTQSNWYSILEPNGSITTFSGSVISYVNTIAGFYQVTAINDFGCQNSKTISIVRSLDSCIVDPISIVDKIPTVSFSIYPNPAKGSFVIESDLPTFNYIFEAYDLMGRRVKNLKLGENNLPSGFYLIRYGKFSQKLIVE